jgi:hypothetical protein
VKNHKTRAAETARVNTQISQKRKGISPFEQHLRARAGNALLGFTGTL